ncbi:RF-1 domain-domain-containing protein [Absidia repens]|uniref:RF-1 domain-domain-containing protein n=1 Tax=Absidia repens TaxID=90262 RepID=A0A1X2IR35_9FUNG|nr:RF-1 domain-domain-containing protein [Absidia repens]
MTASYTTASTKPTNSGSAPTAKSTTTLKAIRQKIVLNDEDLVEKFVKGSGPGGQCINKRSSCVDLRHIPTGIRVQCQQTRSLQENRGIARKLLKEKLDDLWNGSLSKNAKKSTKIAKQKARNARRAKQKYGSSSSSSSTVDTTSNSKTQTE